MPKTPAVKDDFADENQIPSNWMKWGVSVFDKDQKENENPDKIFGTLMSKKQVKSTMPGKEGELVWVYEMKAQYGSFHALDEKKNPVDEATTINDGDIYSIGGNATIDSQMTNIKVGQVIGLKFIEEKPSKTKGFSPAKIVKVFAPKNDDGSFKMDEEFLAERNSLDGEFTS